jgi:hypothetical protein
MLVTAVRRMASIKSESLMTNRILKGGLLGISLATLAGCADLGLQQADSTYADRSMVLSAAPDERGNGNQGNSQRGNAQGGRGNGNDSDDVDVDINIGFDEIRRLAVANNLTGYDALPPGIRKNLARGKPLPPGIAKRAVPSGMLGQLPVRNGHEWQISGTDLVLVETGTLLVVELLEGVFQ